MITVDLTPEQAALVKTALTLELRHVGTFISVEQAELLQNVIDQVQGVV